MTQTEHEYSKDGVTVIWKPALCIHSARCVKGLGAVFNPKVRPWIDMDAAPVERIAEQVQKCPSGALTLRLAQSGD
jgi:putative redox protein